MYSEIGYQSTLFEFPSIVFGWLNLGTSNIVLIIRNYIARFDFVRGDLNQILFRSFSCKESDKVGNKGISWLDFIGRRKYFLLVVE